MQKVTAKLAQDLKITSFPGDNFTYYSWYNDDSSVFGYRLLPDQSIEIRVMYIDNELLEDEEYEFIAERDASPFIRCSVSDCRQILHIIENDILQETVSDYRNIRHFQRLDASQLQELHYTLKESNKRGRFYRYNDESTQNKEEITIILLPYWYKHHDHHSQKSSLWFFALTPAHLKQERFDLITGSTGLGTITFTREGIKDLVSMIRKTFYDLK